MDLRAKLDKLPNMQLCKSILLFAPIGQELFHSQIYVPPPYVYT